MADGPGDAFSSAYNSSARSSIAYQQQKETERYNQTSQIDDQIKKTLGIADATIKHAIDAGNDPRKIAAAVQPLFDSAASLAQRVSPEYAQNVQNMGRAMLAKLQAPAVGAPPPAPVSSAPLASPVQPQLSQSEVITPAQVATANPAPVAPVATPTPNERVAGGFEDAGLPTGAAPIQSTANAKASDIPIADPKVNSVISSGLIGRDSLDFRAELWLLDQNSAKGIARGKEGAAITNAIVSRGTEIARARGIAPGEVNAQSALTGSSRKALDQIIKTQNALEAFEKTAEKNGDAMVALAKQIDTTGIPVIESITRRGKQALGDPNVAAFFTQYELYKAEVAKILTQSNMQGVLTDTARKEIESAIQPNASYKQLVKVHELLKADFGRRNEANQEQVDKIMNSFSQRGRQPASSEAPASPAHRVITPSGAKFWIE